jgi:hypothetical protein
MPHDHGGGAQAPSPFEELIRLQTAFQQNLSQATMNYLRQLQGLVGPVTPGTVVERLEVKALSLSIAPGATTATEVRVENRQRVHSMVTPMLSPLVSDKGTTWFAEAGFTPPTVLLATDETAGFDLKISAPKDMPLGVYRGAVLIYGCADGVVPLEVKVAATKASPAKATAPAAKPAAATRKSAARPKTGAKARTKTTASRRKSDG